MEGGAFETLSLGGLRGCDVGDTRAAMLEQGLNRGNLRQTQTR